MLLRAVSDCRPASFCFLLHDNSSGLREPLRPILRLRIPGTGVVVNWHHLDRPIAIRRLHSQSTWWLIHCCSIWRRRLVPYVSAPVSGRGSHATTIAMSVAVPVPHRKAVVVGVVIALTASCAALRSFCTAAVADPDEEGNLESDHHATDDDDCCACARAQSAFVVSRDNGAWLHRDWRRC